MSIEIPLTQGQVAIVDDIDADLAELKWCALKAIVRGIFYGYYARRSNPHQMMHRVILGRQLGRDLLRSEDVDHIDGNRLNNRRGNLRLSSRAQNRANSRRNTNSTTGFKGVAMEGKRYRAQISINRQTHRIGAFDTPHEAHAAYMEAAIKTFGEFANDGNGKK